MYRPGTGLPERSHRLVFDLEIIKQRLVFVLGGQAGIGKIAVDVSPFTEAAVIEPFQVIGDDERDL